jgi:biotin carboxylase
MKGSQMYRLKATLGTKKKWIHLVAESDSQAVFEAVGYILNEATTKEVWAKGAITLTNPSGEVIQTMEAKA